MSEPLKPCPFCGGAAETGFEDGHNGGHVRCTECGVTGPVWSNNTDTAVEAWNQRAERLDRPAGLSSTPRCPQTEQRAFSRIKSDEASAPHFAANTLRSEATTRRQCVRVQHTCHQPAGSAIRSAIVVVAGPCRMATLCQKLTIKCKRAPPAFPLTRLPGSLPGGWQNLLRRRTLAPNVALDRLERFLLTAVEGGDLGVCEGERPPALRCPFFAPRARADRVRPIVDADANNADDLARAPGLRVGA